ncbi:MAG: hypothetical protein ABL882_12460 [Sphingopyxis sp.]
MTTVVLFWRAEHQLNLIVGLLFATPIIASIGTVNGFAQVQLYVFSWCMLIGVSYLICLRFASNKIKVLLSVFVVTAFLSMTGYFIKQMQPGNFAGYSSISENNNQILFGPLKGIWVDQDTSQLLVEINKIIAAYPHAPTVAFFDAPGLQYALGRDSAISDPWLSNLDQPRTKDDAYNCKMITSITLKESTQSIFIVTHQKEMSEQLKTCLGALGYPDKLKFLGLIKTNVGGLTEPVEIYLHP